MNFSAGNNEYVGYTNMDITSRVPLDATSDLPQTEPLDVANSDHYGIAADFQTVGTSENYSLTRNDRRYGYQNNSEGFMRDIPGTSSQSHIHQRGFINEEYQSFNTVDPMFDPDQLQLHCSSNNLYSNVESQTKFFAVPEFVNESSTSLNVSRPSNGYDQRSATSLNNFEVFQNTPTRSCSTFRQSIESERKLRIKASNQRSQAKLRAHNKLVVQTFEENDQLINKMRTEFNNGKDSKELLTYLLNGYKFLPSLKSLAPPQVLSSEKSIPQRDPTFMNVAYAVKFLT
uniref:BZIP domain-containing protein n=1 Tax=Panagrolaimus sp. ES5 TaxID=591445 RepID=A0AC34FSD1_9BILA